jgi:hypothetical protein
MQPQDLVMDFKDRNLQRLWWYCSKCVVLDGDTHASVYMSQHKGKDCIKITNRTWGHWLNAVFVFILNEWK